MNLTDSLEKSAKELIEYYRYIGEAHLGKPSPLKSRSFKGHKHTEETKKKLSKSKIGKNNPMFGKKSWNKRIKMYNEKPNDPLFVEDKLTPLTEAQATYYLREGWNKLFGEYPKLESLALLWSQSALESFRWRSIHHYNYGNIKKLPGVKYTSFKCDEIINGKRQWFVPYHPQTFFAAWEDPVEGAAEYIKFVSQRKRYQKAWQAILEGDPAKFSHELKVAGYYTADESLYTRNVVLLTNEFKRKSQELLNWKPVEEVSEPEPQSDSTEVNNWSLIAPDLYDSQGRSIFTKDE